MPSPSLSRRAIPPAARVSTWDAPDGWKLRRFDWSAAEAPRGNILFQPGRGDIFEKYIEAFAHWHGAGWSVTALDWRGQGGSGRLSPDAHVGHVEDFETYLADFRVFWREWAADATGPCVLMGHSMGGHLALRALVAGDARPTAAVLVAPMLGLHTPAGARGGELLAALMCRVGDPARAAWKSNERPGTTLTRQALLTHDAERYEDEGWWQSAQPDLLLGPPSWRWLREAFRSTRLLRGDPALAAMQVPVLLLVADADRLVRAADALRVAARLPDATVIRFGSESAHEILREADGVRTRALGEIDSFLAARAPR